jgi:polyvinyl alcohol dehydrogenase (cytochrome)
LSISQAWASSTLSGDIYGEPLVYGGQVIVATEGNVVYALNESTGHVTWHATAGTPAPAGQLPCGNISPNVGITSTPVVDPATGRVFVVADTWEGSHANPIAHRLYAFNPADGSLVSGFPVNVDPPGSIPADQLQRMALALDDGKIFIGYGGNDGDCGTYNGWLVAVPESGSPVKIFQVDPGSTGGATWGARNDPAVGHLDNLWWRPAMASARATAIRSRC